MRLRVGHGLELGPDCRDRERNWFDCGEKAITPARHRLNEKGILGIVTERRADLRDTYVQGTIEVYADAAPDLPAKPVAVDNLARISRQEQQYFERLRLQPQQTPITPQLAAGAVYFERAES